MTENGKHLAQILNGGIQFLTHYIINKFPAAFGFSTTAKADRIYVLRKQYESYLEEDKKRKERNNYILSKLDKIRTSNSLIPQNFLFDRQALPASPVRQTSLRTSSSQQCNSQNHLQDSPTKNDVNENILKQLVNKYILIPKRIFNVEKEAVLNDPAAETTIQAANDQIDWKRKYEILDKLKQNEIQNDTYAYTSNNSVLKTHAHNENTNLDSSLNQRLNPQYDYKAELPERDVPNQNVKYENQNSSKERVQDNIVDNNKPKDNEKLRPYNDTGYVASTLPDTQKKQIESTQQQNIRRDTEKYDQIMTHEAQNTPALQQEIEAHQQVKDEYINSEGYPLHEESKQNQIEPEYDENKHVSEQYYQQNVAAFDPVTQEVTEHSNFSGSANAYQEPITAYKEESLLLSGTDVSKKPLTDETNTNIDTPQIETNDPFYDVSKNEGDNLEQSITEDVKSKLEIEDPANMQFPDTLNADELPSVGVDSAVNAENAEDVSMEQNLYYNEFNQDFVQQEYAPEPIVNNTQQEDLPDAHYYQTPQDPTQINENKEITQQYDPSYQQQYEETFNYTNPAEYDQQQYQEDVQQYYEQENKDVQQEYNEQPEIDYSLYNQNIAPNMQPQVYDNQYDATQIGDQVDTAQYEQYDYDQTLVNQGDQEPQESVTYEGNIVVPGTQPGFAEQQSDINVNEVQQDITK